MDLLITTSYSILKLNTNTSKFKRVHSGGGLYYGIHQYKGYIYVATRNRMVSSDTHQDDERGEILVFNTNLKLKNHIQAPFPLRDIHQIAWHDKKLWITCSYDNMIAIWDGSTWQRWHPLSEQSESPKDIHHYNSLMFEDDKIWLLAHNHGKSEILTFSLKQKTLLQRKFLGSQSHNIWREKKQIFTCSSEQGEIISDTGFKLKTGSFPRGYASYKQERYVGISQLAERQKRDLTTGKVLVFDINWRLKNTINLIHEGLVLDILPLTTKSDTNHKWCYNIKHYFNNCVKKTS